MNIRHKFQNHPVVLICSECGEETETTIQEFDTDDLFNLLKIDGGCSESDLEMQKSLMLGLMELAQEYYRHGPDTLRQGRYRHITIEHVLNHVIGKTDLRRAMEYRTRDDLFDFYHPNTFHAQPVKALKIP